MDVVVVGSCNIDLVSFAKRLPKPGETVHGHKYVQNFGGKGANQCVAASRLGAKTALIAKVGKDNYGLEYVADLKKNQVNTDHILQTSDAHTGVAFISVDDGGANFITIVSGANLLMSRKDVEDAEPVIKSAKVVVCQLETRKETSLAAMELARKHAVTTLFNPAPADQLSDEFYKFCDIICPNETEAELLTGVVVNSVCDAKKAAQILQSKGCSTVIITLGKNGAVFMTSDTCEAAHVPCKPVKAIDTTGAGDAFVGALAFQLATRPDAGLAEQIQFACNVASQSVTLEGTQPSFPWADQVSVKK